MAKLVCLEDYRKAAVAILPRNARDYYESGAEDEETLRDNIAAYSRYKLRPRVLRDVTNVDVSTTILGHPVSTPVGIAPSAMQCLAHPEGERGTSYAAALTNSVMILSTYSTVSLEDVAAHRRSILSSREPNVPLPAVDPLLWFQLYVYTDRSISEAVIKRAERAGFGALVLTVDAPVLGRRLNDHRNKFALPPHLTLANFDPSLGIRSQSQQAAAAAAAGGKEARGAIDALQGSMIRAVVGNTSDTGMTWENDIKWVRGVTKMKIVIKGVMSREDAEEAVRWGVDAIIVSNHGGRQLDSVPATLDVLPEIVAACRGSACEVYVDGGIRKGTDVAKALAMGARAVFVGRPALWGLTVGGGEGCRDAMQLLKEELIVAMTLLGCRTVGQLGPEHVRHQSRYGDVKL
ncbi:Hydroxyacid oxidase 1 [Irineochytrium annulatum]|nr:Hydroxyacid oxidase 1 [Irineochytrium annulatum]